MEGNKKFLLVSFILAILLAIGEGIGLFLLSKELRGTLSSNEELKNRIEQLEKSMNPEENEKPQEENKTTTEQGAPENRSDEEVPQEEQPSTTEKIVDVYFSKDPASFDDPGIVVKVQRRTTEEDVYSFAVRQILNGPTDEERIRGYFSPFSLKGSSNCGGYDFKWWKIGKTLKIQICRQIQEVMPPEGYAGASLKAQQRVLNVLHKTLVYGPIEKLEIRDMNGNCYGKDADVDNLNTCE
uniref:GerMN domain-containing protein n=1 Tax=candidate division CPR3 bacterium TaxID=2268181 RepID=A0A7C5YYK1_UNCC3